MRNFVSSLAKRSHTRDRTTPDFIAMRQWAEFLQTLRNARALVLRDAEAFHEASTVLEHIGQVLAKRIGNGLAAFRGEILGLAAENEYADAEETARLFDVVREARNMAVHEGAWARHLSSRLVDLFLILEEAIMRKMRLVEDIMVRDPVTAESWHLVAHVRRVMLSNSFSYLPIFVREASGGSWRLLTDVVVMRFLWDGKLNGENNDQLYKERLAMRLDGAIASGLLVPTETKCLPPRTPLHELLQVMSTLPVLVTDETNDESRLLGIITPFDLL